MVLLILLATVIYIATRKPGPMSRSSADAYEFPKPPVKRSVLDNSPAAQEARYQAWLRK
jgi:hypothetical protein